MVKYADARDAYVTAYEREHAELVHEVSELINKSVNDAVRVINKKFEKNLNDPKEYETIMGLRVYLEYYGYPVEISRNDDDTASLQIVIQ